MTMELLNKLIKAINDINSTMQYDFVNECMQLLDFQISEQDIEKYENTHPNNVCYERKDIYTHLIIQHIEPLLTEEQLKYFQESLLTHYVAFTSNDELKKEKALEAINKSGITNWENTLNYTVEYFIKYIYDDAFILDILNTYKDELKIGSQIKLVIALKNNDEIKLSYIDKAKKSPYKLFELIKSMKSDELKTKLYEEYKESFEEEEIKFEELLPSIQSDDIKVEYLIEHCDKCKKVYYKKILYSLQSEEAYIKMWDYVTTERKEIIIHSFKDPNKQYEYIKKLDQEAKEKNETIKSKNLNTIIARLPFELVKKLTEECTNISFDIIPIIKRITDQDFNIELLRKYGTKSKSRLIRKKPLIHSDYIIKNIDLILDLEEVENKERIKEIILELYKTNNDIIHTIEWDFLKDKYINTLGLEKINVIGSFPYLISDILDFNDHQYEIFYKSINYYTSKHNDFDWNNAAQQILAEIHFGNIDNKDWTQYVTDINTVNMDNLLYILLNGDIIGIKSQEDINNYHRLIFEKSVEKIKDKDLDQKKDAIFLKGFGLSDYSNMLRAVRRQVKNGIRRIYYLYGEDIHLIENEELKRLFNFIKKVIECDSPEELDKIYENIVPTQLDTYKLESLLKSEYLKLYNKLLLDPKTLKQDEEGLYDAGVDFNIITTSVGAYHSIRPENYKSDWNRPSLASPHFCASYIRNDMLGTAPVHNVLYGFSSMGANSLALSGAGDIYSHGTSLISQSEESEKYYGPEKQLYISAQNGKFKYNEMDFKRIQDGVKKSPDYILVFKRDGVIDNIEEAKKASSDWDNLPIVVIDVNKVLDSEKEKLVNLINEFYTNPTKEQYEKIKIKITNNRVIEPTFAQDIDLEELHKLIPTQPIFKPNALQ